MEKIKVVSRVVQVLLVIYALLHIGFWGYGVLDSSSVELSKQTEQATLYFEAKFEGKESEAKQLTAIGMNPALWLKTPDALFQLAIYVFLFLLFQQYRVGNIYSITAVSQIRRIGICIMAWPLFEVFYSPLLIICLKLFDAVEHGEINFKLGSDNLELMAIGLMITVVGWIIAEGTQLKEEQDLTI